MRDKKTGKSKGFCFLCYEDQRSTVLAVDNFNGIKVSVFTKQDLAGLFLYVGVWFNFATGSRTVLVSWVCERVAEVWGHTDQEMIPGNDFFGL